MKAAAIFLVFGFASTVAGADWLKLKSENFELFTSGTEREGRETLELFEQTRDFFVRIHPLPQKTTAPLRLVSFGTAREYRPYQLKELTPAYFTTDGQRDYIVMSDLGELRARAAVHEYVHVLVRHSGLRLPMWLNEGMADVYSSMQVREGAVLVGATIKDRSFSLVQDKWMRLPDLFAVGMNSAAYNEADRIGIFYAQSWLLAHMLMLGNGYAEKFPAFVAKLSETGSAQLAFSDVYNRSVADIQAAMNGYLRGEQLGGAGYRTTLRVGAIGAAGPADPFDVELMLAQFAGILGRTAEAVERFDRLNAAGVRVEIDEARAFLSLRNQDFDMAERYFEAAVQHGSTAPLVKEALDVLRRRDEGPALGEAKRAEAAPLPPEEGDRPPARPVLRRGKQK